MYNLYIMNSIPQLRQAQPHDLTRTQIYLSRQQNSSLLLVCRQTSASKSEIIRLAIDQFLTQQASTPLAQAPKLQALAGLWSDRADMADPTAYVKQLRAPRF